MSSGSPFIHAPKLGDASSPFRRIANAELADRRGERHPDECGQVEAAALLPLVEDQVRQQDVLAARQRIGIDADESEQTADIALDLVGHGLVVVHVRRRLERPDDVDADPTGGSGGVDGEVDLRSQLGDRCAGEPPAPEAVAPGLGLSSGEVGDTLARLGRVAFVDPRLEVGRREVREGEAEVGEVALRVDQQGGHARAQCLLDQHDTEAGLARAGHADDHAVGGEVARRHIGRGIRALLGGRVDLPAEVEVSHRRAEYPRPCRSP
jgi:hypothetical protein